MIVHSRPLFTPDGSSRGGFQGTDDVGVSTTRWSNTDTNIDSTADRQADRNRNVYKGCMCWSKDGARFAIQLDKSAQS
jgi:hypothetical protein